MTEVLLPLYVDPLVDPGSWHAAATVGDRVTVVVADPAHRDAVVRLARSGTAALGRVDAAHATRPLADLLDAVDQWCRCPVAGIFIDQAPTSVFSLGPVAVALRLAHRRGLSTVVLNPGIPPDPAYRRLPAAMCTFEGGWEEYRRWSGDGALPGDGHLVHGVPATAHAEAQALLRTREAGFGLVTDRPADCPYGGAPRWLFEAAPLPAGAAGSGDTSRTTGS